MSDYKLCPKYEPLDCIDHCSDVILDLVAPATGTYTFKFRMGAGRALKVKAEFNQGTAFVFNTGCLNECSHTVLEIYDQDGVLISFQDADCTYDGFSFITEIITCE